MPAQTLVGCSERAEEKIMLDYLRDLTKSEEEKREERLSAYLDGALTPREQRQVEQQLAQDNALAQRLEDMRLLRQQMRQLPLRHVRRNFTLDPALYGRPKREPLVQAYPVLRTATALAAFLFIFLVAANIFFAGAGGMAPAAEAPRMEAAGAQDTVAQAGETVIAETRERVVTEITEIVVEEESESEALLMEEEAASAEEAAPAEEAVEAEEMPPLAEVEVEPSFDLPAEEARSEFDASGADAAEAVPQEEAEQPQRPEALASPPGEAAIAAPTMIAEAAEAVEVQPAPAPREPAIPDQEAGQAERVKEEGQLIGGGLSLLNTLWVIAILAGIVLMVLFVLTLLARRRL